YSARSSGTKQKAARWRAEGARNPHAATISRRGRGAVAVLHAANRVPNGPSAAKPSRIGSQTAVPASPGLARSSTQRPAARRTATTPRRRPPAAPRHAAVWPDALPPRVTRFADRPQALHPRDQEEQQRTERPRRHRPGSRIRSGGDATHDVPAIAIE